MIAKNKITGTTFKVLTAGKDSFSGKVINDPNKSWKPGEICHNLNKSNFNLIVDWGNYDKVYMKLSQLKDTLKSL